MVKKSAPQAYSGKIPAIAMRIKALFPISYLSSQLGMTGLLVIFGLSGQIRLAADVGVVQAAALALFLGFSGNARSLIFKSTGTATLRSILVTRLILMAPLAGCAYYLGSILGGVPAGISIILVMRKCVEWLSELHLSAAERDRDRGFAALHLAVQSILLGSAGLCAVLESTWLLTSLAAWALIPLVPSLLYLLGVLKTVGRCHMSGVMLLPHLGSSIVTGIGVYVFRLTLLLLVGRDDAGILYTAFAIGGVLGSFFSFGFGPSMVLNEQRTGRSGMGTHFQATLWLVAAAGLFITAGIHFLPEESLVAGKCMLFWQALGFSLIGSVVMVFAHRQRLRDLQRGAQDDVFAPDVLVNIIIVIFIPTIFFIFGIRGMTWLYLFNASVALVFYWMTEVDRASKIIRAEHRNTLRAGIAVLIALPLFVNLETGLFRSAEFLYDSGGILRRLPVPVSVFACYVGIALLGNYRRANLALAFVFATFVIMVLTTFSTTFDSQSAESSKLSLFLQFVIPMFALVLGMIYEAHDRGEQIFEKSFLVVIAALVPFQLVASWFQGRFFLTPYLYGFSVYQHLQYVPVVMVAGYVLALFALWKKTPWKSLLLVVSPLVGIYATASASLSALGFGLVGSAAFLAVNLRMGKATRRGWICWLPPLLFVISFGLYNLWVSHAANMDKQTWASKATKTNASSPLATGVAGGMYAGKISISKLEFSNVKERQAIWRFYAAGILRKPSAFFSGQSRPPERGEWASAHNYYLDFVYNFGVVALVPILCLIGYTLWLLSKNRDFVMESQATIGLTLVTALFLLCDNSLKVGMRTPYSGIATFFLWGLLLSRIGGLPPGPFGPALRKSESMSVNTAQSTTVSR